MRIHIIKPGDSLYSLASKYHVTVEEIMKLNPNINANNLQVGSKIRIPSASHSNHQQVEIVHQHMVKPGDSLWKLSQTWGVSFDELVAANKHLSNPNVLHVGDVINIPKAGQGHATQGQTGQTSPGHTTGATSPVGQLIEQLIPGLNYYTVKAGDTLYKIAQEHNISLDVLIAFNPQLSDPNQLTVGMKIVIPKTGTVHAQSANQTQQLSTKAQALSTKAQLTSPMQQGKAAQTAPMTQVQAVKPQAQPAAKPQAQAASKPSLVQKAAKAAAKTVVEKMSANKVQSAGKVQPLQANKTQALGNKVEATQTAKTQAIQSNTEAVKLNIGGNSVAASKNANALLSQQLANKSNAIAAQQAPATTKLESLSTKVEAENKLAAQSTKVSSLGNNVAPMATGNKMASLAAENKVASMATGNKMASLAAENKVASMATGNNVASMATGNNVAPMATGNKMASLAAENKVASMATGNNVAPMATGNNVASMATGNNVALLAAENKVASMATGNKMAPITTKVEPVANKMAPMAQKVEPVANKMAPMAQKIEPVANKMAPMATKVEPVANKMAPMAQKIEPIANKMAPMAQKIEPMANKIAPMTHKIEPVANKSMNYAAKVEQVAQSPYYSNKPFPNQMALQGNEGLHPYQVNSPSYLSYNQQLMSNTPSYTPSPSVSPYQTGFVSPNQYGQTMQGNQYGQMMQGNQYAQMQSNQYGQMQGNQYAQMQGNQYGQMQSNQYAQMQNTPLSSQQAHLNSVGGFTAQSAMYPPIPMQSMNVTQPMTMPIQNCGCGGNVKQVPLYQYANHQANDANMQVQEVAGTKAATTKKKSGKKVMITQHDEVATQQKRDGRPWMNI